MKNDTRMSPFTGLRGRLLLLVLIIFLPIIGLTIYQNYENTNEQRLLVLNESLTRAKAASVVLSQIIEGANLTLRHLSLLPEFQQHTPEASSRILSSFLKQNDLYAGLSAQKTNGEVIATAPNIAKKLNNADRPWIQRLLKTRSAVIGEYTISRISGKPTIVLANPVFDNTGRLVMIFSLGLDLEKIQTRLKNIPLPYGSDFTVIDHDGTIILRLPEPDKFIGKNIPEKPIISAILKKKEGFQEEIGLDGVHRLFGFTTIGSGIEALHLSISTPEKVAFTPVRQKFVKNIIFIGLVGITALFIAWLFSGAFILSPTKHLLKVTRRVADGDLTVRTGQSNASGEFGLLAHNFDLMAESLQRREEDLRDTLQNLRKAVGVTIQVMASAVETRDPYTSGHQTRSADLARAIAMEMGLPEDKIDAIRMAGSIHDIGKLSIPAEILAKPTKLSDIEFALIKEHAHKGYEILKNVKSPWPLAEIVRQHHERMDGSGYPRNLKGEDILIEARVLTVADVVEAMASHRPYRPGLGIDAALNEIEKNRGTYYDNTVVDACLKLFRERGFQLAVA